MKFAIYHKSKKFNWSVDNIFLISFVALLIIYGLVNIIFGTENYFSQKILPVILLGGLFVSLITRFLGFFKIEKASGILKGFISFNDDSIEVDNIEYNLEDIKRIEISNEDYRGKLSNLHGFGAALSNGTDNYIVLHFIAGKSKKYNFEMIDSNDFQKIRIQLIKYHIKSKIDFWSLAHILGEKSPKETSELTNEIKKHYC